MYTDRGLRLSGITLDVRDGSRGRRLLDHVDLHVAPGELVGVIGPSGSGKSTLLAVAGALQRPGSGTAVLGFADGGSVDLAKLGGRAAARVRRDHVGLIFQQPNLQPALTVREQLIAMTRLARILPPSRAGRRAADARAMELLDAVGLADLADRRIPSLSGGQQARVNVARALMNQPDLVLADEPTAALDRESAAAVTALIGSVARDSGAAALYVTHDRAQLAGADRVVEMVDGRLGVPAPA